MNSKKVGKQIRKDRSREIPSDGASTASQRMKCKLPPIYQRNEFAGDNQILQISSPCRIIEALVEWRKDQPLDSLIVTPLETDPSPILVFSKAADTSKKKEIISIPPKTFKKAIQVACLPLETSEVKYIDLSDGNWVKHPDLRKRQPTLDMQTADDVLSSWKGSFQLTNELSNGIMDGLRPPQAGALHAVNAHWATSDEAATIVMPTGTGKTEVMLSVLVSFRCPRVLVIVPTDALRTQIAEKFLTLGVLKKIGVVSEHAQYPIVGILRNRPKTTREVDEWLPQCNVIVTTVQVAGVCPDEIKLRLAQHCPYLFIDEAHHLGAKTWSDLRKCFSHRRILQFTATPFRNDDKLVDGKIIFNYPLKKALDDGYFKPIHFRPIQQCDPQKVDEELAKQAVQQLRRDLKAGLNHILMARVENIQRAKDVFAIYSRYKEFNPIQIHSGIGSEKDREALKAQLLDGHSRIVVCVDMLGEGFDLPELKIAAFHDVRKSLPVTIQLAGRFTRGRTDLGEPTIFANIGDVYVRDELQHLYSQDADWNTLLPQTSQLVIRKQIDLWEFLEGFKNLPKEIPLQNIQPTLYTTIYEVGNGDWKPANFKQGIDDLPSVKQIYQDVNENQNAMVIILARRLPVEWADVRELFNLEWELILVHWDKDQRLLFINSSGCKSFCRKLAEALMGRKNIVQITGNNIYRCLYGIRRLKLQNVGLKRLPAGHITYTMLAGPDVAKGLTKVQRRSSAKSNVSGVGFESQEDETQRRVSLGCSTAGRIWSHQRGDLSEITRWCSTLGKKIQDPTIDPNDVLEGTLVPKLVKKRPAKMPIGIEWPETFYVQPETSVRLVYSIGKRKVSIPFYMTDIRLIKPSKKGDIRFGIYNDHENISVELLLTVSTKGFRFSPVSPGTLWINRFGYDIPLQKFFEENPPTIWFHDGSFLEGNRYVTLPARGALYPKEKLIDWDWSGVDIKRESQIDLRKPGPIVKDTDSIQYRLIQQMKRRKRYVLIFDDDDSGESADVVCVNDSKHSLTVEFYHCKYSSKSTPGARVDDLYEVCGQAQKSVHWVVKPEKLFEHLQMRTPRIKKSTNEKLDRFEEGCDNTLKMLINKSLLLKVNFKIYIVQPGLSKPLISDEQRKLLSVTENFLMETYKVQFGVICNREPVLAPVQ